VRILTLRLFLGSARLCDVAWTIRRYLVELVLLANAGAFAVLLAELFILEHTDGFQLVAPVSAATGLVLSLVAIVVRGPARMAVAAAFVILAGSGLIGVTRHFSERDGGLSFALVSTAAAQPGSDDDDDDRSGRRGGDDDDDDDDDDEDPPPLAPLALSGSAMLGALASLAGVPARDAVREQRRL